MRPRAKRASACGPRSATPDSSFPIAATGTIVVSLGPVTVTIEGFGMAQPLRLTTDGSGNLGIIDLQTPSFTTPTGIGVAIDASVVKGGGFLRITDTQIAGALELAISLGATELSVQAFGIIECDLRSLAAAHDIQQAVSLDALGHRGDLLQSLWRLDEGHIGAVGERCIGASDRFIKAAYRPRIGTGDDAEIG